MNQKKIQFSPKKVAFESFFKEKIVILLVQSIINKDIYSYFLIFFKFFKIIFFKFLKV
jgi:hypothetical protein